MSPLSRRAFVTAAATSLLVGCGACAQQGGQDGQGRPGSEQDPPATTARSGSSGTSPATAPDSAEGAGSVRPLGRSAPVRLRIPAIGVDTGLLRLGLAADGTVQVPPVTAHDQAGWYRNSPTPGQTGPSVILGHVTVGIYGDGVFRHLARLRPGDRITTRLHSGAEAGFTVGSVRTVAKADFPTKDVYGDVDRPELRLITCGGPRGGSGYLDNVIVFAALSSTRS